MAQVSAAASAHKDLADARAALDLLLPMTQGDADGRDLRRDGPIGGALFAHAVILYARATATKAVDRSAWFGVDRLSPAAREWHRDVMLYRNRVLAHFGRGLDQPDGPTVREALVYTVVRAGSRRQVRVDFMDARALTKAGLLDKLVALLGEVVPQSRAAYDRRSAALIDELGRAAGTDPGLAAWVRRHPFDARAFFGDEDVLERIRAEGGTASYAVVETAGGTDGADAGD